MNKAERILAGQMLRMAAAHFGAHRCNDFELYNTPENLEFVKAMIAASGYPEDVPNISNDGTKIYLMDWQIMHRCADILEKEA